MSYEQKPMKKCGAIWLKTAKSGNEYISVKLKDVNYVAFKNKYKKQPNHPDYEIYEEDREYTEGMTKPVAVQAHAEAIRMSMEAIAPVSRAPEALAAAKKGMEISQPKKEADFWDDSDVPF